MQKDNVIEDDLRLLEKAKNGDIAAKNILAEKYTALIKKIIFSKKSQFLHLTANPLCDIDDILQEGYMGLLDALNKYDFKKYRVKFKTYAEYRIIGSILDSNRIASFIPRIIIEKIKKIFQAKKELEEKSMAEPTMEDIAMYLNQPVAEIEKTLIYANYQFPFRSIDQPLIIEEDESSLLSDFIADSKKSPLCELEEKEFKEKISFVLSSNILSKREIICVELAFGLNGNEQHKFKNIAIRFRISEARISQIISEALEKLRHNEQIIRIFKEYSNCNNGSS